MSDLAPDTFDDKQCAIWYKALKARARVGDFQIPWRNLVRPEGELNVAQRPISDDNLDRKLIACQTNPTTDYIPCWVLLVGTSVSASSQAIVKHILKRDKNGTVDNS